MTESFINFFLTYGYFPRKPKQTFRFNSYDLNYYGFSLDEIAKKASKLFIENIERLYKSNELHLIPLSGGLDSRAILASLLKFTEAKNLYSFSYGAKGTLDYEIGKKIADNLGINHVSFDLQKYQYTLDDLIYHAKSVKNQTVLFHNPPAKQIDTLFRDFTVWSGIIGDVVCGSAIPKFQSRSFKEAKLRYLNNKTYIKKPFIKNLDSFSDFLFINEIDIDCQISYDEMLIYLERFENYYKPVIEMGENKYQEPFLNSAFTDLMLNAPIEYRESFRLYHNMLRYIDLRIFSLPTKNKLGLGLFDNELRYHLRRFKRKGLRKLGFARLDSGINYQDFNHKYSTQEKFQRLIDNQLDDLNKRDLIENLSISNVLKKFKSNKHNSDLIKTLVSLEIHLKSGKENFNSLDQIC